MIEKRSYLKENDRDDIAFTIKTHLEKGNYVVCQGIFDTDSKTIIESQVLEAEDEENKDNQ